MKKEEKREEIADWLQTYSDGDMKLNDCIEGIMQLQSNWISVESFGYYFNGRFYKTEHDLRGETMSEDNQPIELFIKQPPKE